MKGFWKRAAALALALILICVTVSGCEKPAADQADGKLNVVATIFAPYDFVHQIAGERVNLKMLITPGAESHSFEPTPQDMIAIQNCDVFLYVGGENDEWVRKILDSVDTESMELLPLMECVDVVEEELAPGMEGGEEPHGQDGHEGGDEHVWTSPKNAVKIAERVADTLCRADPDHSEEYRTRAESYVQKLKELDRKFEQVVSDSARKTIVFGDRFPFRYLADAYGLTYYAAFPGCATETEASAATIAFLVKTIREEGIPVVFHMELSNEKMADTLCEATGAQKRLLHACHNVSREDFQNGETYLSLMERNVEELKEALN